MSFIRICTPVTGNTLQEFLSNLEKIQQISDFIELRVDHIQNIKLEDLPTIETAVTKEAVFTCRRQDEDGKWMLSEELRIQMLEKALTMSFQYVDIELSTAKLHHFQKYNETKLILSYHDFNKTPTYEELQQIINEMKHYQADIIKIATNVLSENDNQTLCKLLTNREPSDEMIIIGMGEMGKITRIVGPLLGSYLTFASTPFSQSAPGQIDMHKLQAIYNTIDI